MKEDHDCVREAVLASISMENRIRDAKNDGELVTEEKSKRRSQARPKKRPNTQKPGENWKKLQKSLSTSVRPPRPIRKPKHTKTNNESIGTSESNEDANFSSFMKRQIRNTETPTRVVAMDCEMVGVGRDGKGNALARVSVVNYAGDVLYDTFVKVHESVTDYRTQWSGVRPNDVSPQSQKAVEPYDAQRAVGEILKGRIVVGHAIKNDLRVLRISHPWRDVRDTADFYKKLWKKQGRRGGRGPALRVVVAQVLGVDSFQKKEHDSCEDARAALALYKRNAKEWEKSLRTKSKPTHNAERKP